MRKTFLILVMVATATLVQAQENASPALLKETSHDFGKIPQGKPVYYTFEWVNKGDKPLRIENVSATCGCTTPEWSREPLAAGGAAPIRVGYNAATEGAFEKQITVSFEGGDVKQLVIKGMVWKAPADSAPANASIQYLKKQMQ